MDELAGHRSGYEALPHDLPLRSQQVPVTVVPVLGLAPVQRPDSEPQDHGRGQEPPPQPPGAQGLVRLYSRPTLLAVAARQGSQHSALLPPCVLQEEQGGLLRSELPVPTSHVQAPVESAGVRSGTGQTDQGVGGGSLH